MNIPGVPPVEQLSDPPFTWMHIFRLVSGAAVTTCADTEPGPSVVNAKVRAVPFGSAAESSIRSWKVTTAGKAGPLAKGAAVGVGPGVPVGRGVVVAAAAEVGLGDAGLWVAGADEDAPLATGPALEVEL
jgi:hypothetical protein